MKHLNAYSLKNHYYCKIQCFPIFDPLDVELCFELQKGDPGSY